MATKYSDIIQLQDFLPVYDIMDENPNAWKSFIPTNQFCDMLDKSLTAITSKEISKRKSLWVRGTFGTGKSHASAVVKHLLCDDFSEISDYIDKIHDPALKARIKSLRESGKRYFAVTLKGVERAYDIPRFTLSLQKETQSAIKKVKPDFVVKSDFSRAIDWIERHSDIFEQGVLTKDDELSNFYDNSQEVLNALKSGDAGAYLMLERAVRETIGTVFEQTGISDWLVEVEQEIKKQGIADGLIIFWDEFTSVMDTLKSDRINLLQNIAEKSQKNDVFLFLISHRIESQSSDVKKEEISKMSDRYVYIPYAMDELSTYLIMQHSFHFPSAAAHAEYSNICRSVEPKLTATLDFVTDGNPKQKQHIKSLLPMHPYTAYLCSTISNHVGSSNRSVIKFLHDEESGFHAFLEKPENFGTGTLHTAEALWDFFFTEFDENVATSTFTNIYKSFSGQVEAQGNDYLRVFKTILLLNALSPKFQHDPAKLAPEDKVIQLIFAGDHVENKVVDILNWLDKNNVVKRNVFGVFKITGSSYNQVEMNDKRQEVVAAHRTAVEVLNYDITSKNSVSEIFKIGETVRREVDLTLISAEDNEALIRSKLSKFTQNKPNYLHIAVFFSIREDSRDGLHNILKNFSSDFENVVLILPDETLSANNYNGFVDSVTHSKVAATHFNHTESKEYEKNAHQFVVKWIMALMNNTYTAYFNGSAYNEGTFSQIPDLLNYKLSVKAYTHGFESVKEFGKKGIKDNFFVDKNCPKVILQILEAQQASQITSHGGNPEPIRYIFEDSGNTLLTPSGSLSGYAQNSDLWITKVCRLMDRCMEDARKKYSDRFNLGEILSPFVKEPYGFFTSFANCAALSFAIRKHKDDLFVPGVSQPISDDKLADMLVDIFKGWTKDGKAPDSNKLLLRFGSPEETQLKDLLIDLFDLNKVPGVNIQEIKSLENAKWAVQDFVKKESQYPLWTLLYVPGLSEDQRQAVRDLIQIFDQENPSVEKIKSTYKNLKLDNTSLNIIFTTKANYINGFKNFVTTIEEAPIKSEWWDEMLDEVNTLQSEIAFRKESDVRAKIVAFYIRKITPRPERPTDPINPPINPPVTPNFPDKIVKAKERIKSINMPNMRWQRLALDLLREHPELADFFADFTL